MRLLIAAKLDPVDQDYFDREIRHLFDEPFVTYLGEVDERRKAELLGNAAALLFPIDWPEPFGLVMIEAMASGTPVIAYANGAVPEVIDHAVTGYVVNSLDEAVSATRAALTLDRGAIRARFEARFSVRRMAEDYLALYGQLIAARQSPSARIAQPRGTAGAAR
jgi:glycosyltransferase involved in cell wall biosynthesis